MTPDSVGRISPCSFVFLMGSSPPHGAAMLNHFCRPADTGCEHIFNAGYPAQALFHLRFVFAQTNHMDVCPRINSVADRESARAPFAHLMKDIHRGRLPVHQRRVGGHHYRMHHIRIMFNDIGKGFKVLVQDRIPTNFQTPRRICDTHFLQRTRPSNGMPFRGAGLLVCCTYNGDTIRQVPMVSGRNGESI